LFGILAQGKLPPELARRIDQEVEKALAEPAISDKEQSVDPEIVGLGYGGLAEYLRRELRKWKRAFELSGAKVY
jgi:hypothetical protein